MMQARSNSLNLGWREISDDKNKLCKMYELSAVQTLTHFLILCPSLQSIRNKHVLLQRPNIDNLDEILKRILLFEQTEDINHDDMISILSELWIAREKLLHLKD